MLPKVATHIVHSASRAAASIHQTHTIRNVLQLQHTPGPSNAVASWNTPGSSNWGSNGPSGAGNTKHSTGNRFHYNNAGRAVVVANSALSFNDGSFSQSDEIEDSPQSAIRPNTRIRNRSHSVSLSIQDRHDRAKKLGILKTVQLHARSRHAFATQHLPIQPDAISLEVDSPSGPSFVRRNSTSAPSSPVDASTFPTLSVPESFAHHSVFSHAREPTPSRSAIPLHTPQSPAESQRTLSPSSPPTSSKQTHLDTLLQARNRGDFGTVADAVRKFLLEATSPSVSEFNAALDALFLTRPPGEPLHLLLRTYNEMLTRSVLPNAETYIILLESLTTRDAEVDDIINTLELRLKHHNLTARSDVASQNTDSKRIEALRRENNFLPAMSMFSTLIAIGGDSCPTSVYDGLIRSCAVRGCVDDALRVFAQMEKCARKGSIRPSPKVYKYLIQAHTNRGKLPGAEEAFEEYRMRHQQGLVFEPPQDPASAMREHVKVWNQMIETYFRNNRPELAVDLLEQMLTVQPDSLNANAAPPVATSTFTTVLAGFCSIGDVKTALSWFDRLVQQETTENDPYASIGRPMQPDPVAWSIMFDALSSRGMVKDLSRLYLMKLAASPQGIKRIDRLVVFKATVECLKGSDEDWVNHAVAFLVNNVTGRDRELISLLPQLWDALLADGWYEHATSVLAHFVESSLPASETDLAALQHMQLAFSEKLYDKTHGHFPFKAALCLTRVADKVKATQLQEHIPLFLHSYGLSRTSGMLPQDEMQLRDWELLLYAAVEAETVTTQGGCFHSHAGERVFQGLTSLLEDMSRQGVAVGAMNTHLIKRLIHLIQHEHGHDGLQAIFHKLGPAFRSALESHPSDTFEVASSEATHDSGYCSSPDSSPEPELRIHPDQSKTISEELWATTPVAGADTAYTKFRQGIEAGVAPSPAVIGLLIQSLGRGHKIDELHYTYTAAQAVLHILNGNKVDQRGAWFIIEDSMIIALAHHGDVDGAHVHRKRILEQGGSPTADAYGALIYHVKDTTDDTTNALALFNESQRLAVTPNQYLYNNIISKLAKARKADYALELFQQMKATGVLPTSVTYGAVIGACARVGDVQSAETLFDEMASAKSFKPRVPPYNTMMQLYTTTRPNRERALHYYEALCKAGISPSGHTYKLLMDSYGTIEPVDIRAMERVFEQLRRDTRIPLQGIHFSSLINAYGCVQKNMERAIQVFNSISSHPGASPDAVVFEAMINALVANRRTDLIPEWLEKMNLAGVHMTAYIANFLIKGYCVVGDIEKARAVFESLEDPPQGVAAPHSYPPDPSISPADCTEPVYREPSTWEAMVRAELGSGNRQGAFDLLERLKLRQYPEAVYNRISGIMIDHSLILP